MPLRTSQKHDKDPAINAGIGLFKSFTVRLALIYIGLFSLSVILLFAFIYGFATRYVDNQINMGIESQFERIHSAYKRGGTRAAQRQINDLVRSDEEGTEIYILTNSDGERIVGNLEAWPQYDTQIEPYQDKGTWLRFTIEGTRNYPFPVAVRAISYPLSKWRHLLVGESLLDKRKLQQIIIQTFWASLLVTIAIACIGAMLMAKSIGHRINIINRSAKDIMDGQMSARIPRSGVGDQFDVLSENLNNMLDKIELLLKSLSEFSNNIAHDLRTPLNRIIARTEAGLRGMKETSAGRKLLEANVQDMEGLIGTFNSILKISELEASREGITLETCHIAGVINDMVELYEPLATEKGQTIQREVDEAMTLEAEPKLLAQALANLLDNAIKFGPEGSQITVGLKREHEHTMLWVADQGAGIPKESRDKVFGKFVRLEESRSKAGNGLGLSLVAAIAHIHGAQITLEDNTPGLRVAMVFTQSGQ